MPCVAREPTHRTTAAAAAEYILSMTILTASITGNYTVYKTKQNKENTNKKNKKRTVSYAGTSHKVGIVCMSDLHIRR